MKHKLSHKALFEKLRDTGVITKCTQYAHWTLPQLMADYATTRGANVVVERDYQEIGALLTNNLSTKLAGILFPTTVSFLRITPSAGLERKAAASGLSKTDFITGLAKMEMEATRNLFLNASYAQLILALKHLIVTGNVLMYRDSTTKQCITYGLQSFVVRRDGRGTLLDCILREFSYFEALEPEIQGQLKAAARSQYADESVQVEIYTRIKRERRDGEFGFVVTQEIDTTPVGTESWYPAHLCPWFVPTWSLIAGEHYGRGMVEDYAGGFAKLSDLSEAQTLYSVEMMRVLHLVSASAGTDIDDYNSAETGDYLRGDRDSVTVHEGGDAMKLEQTAKEIERVFMRLAKAFMYQANVRDAERVTMYELRRDAAEAEHALGGVYSTLSQGIQLPLAHVLLTEVDPAALEGIITKDLKLSISAGLSALGRSTDVQNLLSAGQEIAALVPLTQLDSRLDPKRIVDICFAGHSVDTSAVYFSQKEQEEIDNAKRQVQEGEQQLLTAASVADQGEQLGMLQQ